MTMGLLLWMGLGVGGMASGAPSCEDAKTALSALRAAVPTACTTTAQCGFSALAYDACRDPVAVNKAEITAGQREAVVAAVQTARAACSYVMPPCPAPLTGEPVCYEGQCTGTIRAIQDMPEISLAFSVRRRMLGGQAVQVAVKSHDAPGGAPGSEPRAFETDARGQIAVPMTWLLQGGMDFEVVFTVDGFAERRIQGLRALLEASQTPLELEPR